MNEEKKAYHVFFSFDAPTTGQLIAIGKDEDEAKAKFLEHLGAYNNIVIHEMVNVSDVQSLQQMINLEEDLQQGELDLVQVEDKKVH